MNDSSAPKLVDKKANASLLWPWFGGNDLLDYWVDAWQRSILLLDTLGQRGNNSAGAQRPRGTKRLQL